MAKIRTFVAVEVSGAVQGLVHRTIKQLSGIAGDYRWQEPENMHLTLNFLGDIQEREIPEVCRCVERAVDGVNEFAIEVGGLGAFPRPTRPRVLWLGLTNGVDELVALQNQLTTRLDDEMGFPPDRNGFTPHVTVGRANRSSCWTAELIERVEQSDKSATAQSFIDEVIVFSSHVDRGRPTYTPMATFELGMA